ncbi:unnamed protein product [Rotaria socialis]|uniref:RING-type domain-containing protein n=1 Tax=Rotaria socialis TaxID=392032 RepID=A0A820FXQ7_9BILA|nr:unnamed protein product [Rotaria socialis]CAF4269059.1 unnamed protein product [Rotaria socialis]CAF4556185.1 unnamed protein product [Rotaria socialis]
MAEIESLICYYSYMNESMIDANLTCSIRKNPLYDPLVTPLCDHIFCSMCIKPWLEINDSCPSCRHSPLIKDQLQKPNRPLLNLLNELLIRCKRCGEENTRRGDFMHHIRRVCPKANINCSAADIKCPWTGRPDQLDIHLKTCIYTQMKPLHNEWMATTTKLTENIEALEEKIAELVVMNILDRQHFSAKLFAAEIKQILGEHVYPVIKQLQPNLPDKITGMLLELDNNEILKLAALDSCLKKRVEEAVALLEARCRKI